MSRPWILHVAYFLGMSPYSQLCSLHVFYYCGAVSCLYVILVGVLVVQSLVTSLVSSVIIVAVIYRTFVTCYCVIIGFVDMKATNLFYDRVFSEIETLSSKRSYVAVDIYCVMLFLLVLPEVMVITGKAPLKDVLFLISACLNTIIPLVTMVMFCLCCVSVYASYQRLQEDILKTSSRTAAFTVSRLRLHQVDIVEHVRDISNIFGLRLLLYILMIQLILLEKIDYLINGIASNSCGLNCLAVIYSFLGYMVALWYFSYTPWKAAGKHWEALHTVLDLRTRDMDAAGLQEIALLAEQLQSRPTVFSASGCFTMGFSLFYSVVGIIFSYIIIVGPLAYNKHKHLFQS